MATEQIGKVTTGKTRKTWKVYWNPATKVAYCGSTGKNHNIGKASSAGEAMRKAEAYCYNK